MSTYKKTGKNKTKFEKKEGNSLQSKDTTAGVFNSLDTGASKAERFVLKYQTYFLGIIIGVTLIVLGYVAYNNIILKNRNIEATNEITQAQYYFNLAVAEGNDSLFVLSLEGGEGKYGFLDIIKNYRGTATSKLATYSAGMAYLNLKDYENAILYLDKFSTDDVLLSTLSLGAIGDAFMEINQSQEALQYYEKAIKKSNNNFTTPKYLYKAAKLKTNLGENTSALSYFNRIKKEFPDSKEAKNIDLQIGYLEHLGK